MAPPPESTPASARLADRPLEQNQAKVRLNIKPGYFSSVAVQPEATQTYALVMERLNPHEKWTSLQTLCATGEPGGRKVEHQAA